MTEPDWATELGVHASETALEVELAAGLDAEGSQLTDRNETSAFWGGVRAWIVRPIHALEQLLVATAPQGFLRRAKGVWLDEKLVEFGVERKPGAVAEWDITFAREGTVGNVNIPKSTVVASKTLADGTVKRLVGQAAAVLQDGQSEVLVRCKAEAEGAAYNLPPGGYSEMIPAIAGVDTVSNETGNLVVAGVDRETDEDAIARTLEGQKAGGEGWIGGEATYRAIALDFPGVLDAVIDAQEPRGRGTVDVIILGGAGAPTQQLIDDLTAQLDEQGKPITDDVLVRAPTLIPVNVDVTAVAYTTDPRTDPAIQAEVEAVLDGFFTFGVGKLFQRLSLDYVLARVAGEAIATAGLKNLLFTAPTADVAVPLGDLAVAGTRAVTVTREGP